MTKTPPPAVLTVDPAELHGLLTDLLRSSGEDGTLPMICGIHLHVDASAGNTVLVGTSTNRFIAAQAHTAATGTIDPIWLPLDRAKQILAILRPYGRANNLLTELALTDGQLTVRQPGDLVLPTITIAVPVQPIEKFPKMVHLFTDKTVWADNPVCFDPRWLAVPIAVAKRRRETLAVVAMQTRKQTHLTVGDRYRAILMPVNRDSVASVPFFTPPREKAAPQEAAA